LDSCVGILRETPRTFTACEVTECRRHKVPRSTDGLGLDVPSTR